MCSVVVLATLVYAAPAVSEARTLHYQVRSAGVPAEELGQMLEQLYLDLARFFGAVPRGPLELELYADATQYKQALAADQQPYLGGGGYFSPTRRKAYLFVQPSEYFTRQLVLHEATHQFHLQLPGVRLHAACLWYKEGLAEYFGMHTWDGRTLRTGVVPAITLEDYPAQALRLCDKFASELGAIIAGDTTTDRPLYWALVHLAVNRYPRQFAALRRQLHRGTPPAAAWRDGFGPLTPDFSSELREWIATHQQPWQSVWNAWQDRGGALDGASGVTGLAVLKNTPRSLAAEVEPLDGTLQAGLVFDYQSPDDFALLQVFANHRAWIVRRIDGQWDEVASYRVPSATGSRQSVSVTCKAGQAIVTVNGQEIARLPAQGQLGLNVDNCTVRFRVTTTP